MKHRGIYNFRFQFQQLVVTRVVVSTRDRSRIYGRRSHIHDVALISVRSTTVLSTHLSYRLGNLTNLIEVGKKSLLLHRVPSTKQCSPSGPPNGHNNSVTCILWQHLRSTRALQPPTCSATPATPLKVLSRCIHSRHNRCAAPASQSPICTYSARYASAPAPMQRTARHQMISTTLVRINIHNHHAYMG